jgi:translation initiation factor 3 subunit B
LELVETVSNQPGNRNYVSCHKNMGSQPFLMGVQGKFLVLGGLKAMSGQLAFFSADDFEVLSAAEHFMCTDIEWDPTGRYVATAVTSIHQMENGYKIWLFNGSLIYQCVTFPGVP